MFFDNRRQFVLGCLAVSILLGLILIQASSQQESQYNPWLDYNDDGVINVTDLQAFAHAYGTSGTPLNMPMSLKYDSGWIDIHDKQGQYFTVTPGFNLDDTYWTPSIRGKVAANSPVHQKYQYGYDMPGWNRTYQGMGCASGGSIILTNDGGYAVAGDTYSSLIGPSSDDVYLVKTDAMGTMEWNKTYGGIKEDIGNSVIQTSDGGYAISGYTWSFGDGTPLTANVYLVKTDSSGILEWNKTYGGADNDFGYSLVQTTDGGYAIVGCTYSFGVGTPTMSNVYFVRTDSSGNLLWQKTYGGTNLDFAYSLVQTDDGGYAIAGKTSSFGAGADDTYLVKTDSSGIEQWYRTYGGANNDLGYSLIQTDDGEYTIAGTTFSFGTGGPDVSLVKTDPMGFSNLEFGVTITSITADTLTLYRGKVDPYYNYIRIRLWVVKENP